MIFKSALRTIYFFSIILFITSCSSTKTESVIVEEKPNVTYSSSSLSLLFAGDIMAHKNNYSVGNFDKIWEDILHISKSSDFAFANIEAPVNDKKEWSTYPQFNMHSPYVEAAIKAGFNVFSLANNHSNDWYLEGIKSTENYFSNRANIWACGLRKKSNDNLTFKIIEKNGIKILFIAITEILNRPDYASYIDYYPNNSKYRTKLFEQLTKITNENSYDFFVMSIHTDEEEYKSKITESHKIFYNNLIDKYGVDVIWANHPHITKPWEIINTNNKQSLIMYANGNTISGQRTAPSLYKKHTERDNTGDGVLIKVKIKKNTITENNISKSNITIKSVEPYFITTYIMPNGQFVIKSVDNDLLHCLNRSGLTKWAEYIIERKKIFDSIKGKSKCL